MVRSMRGLILSLCLAATAVGCTSSAPGASVAPSLPPQATTFAEFGAAYCAAFDAMFTAIGNPDTGSGSELSKALDAAMAAREADRANGLAAAITGHLERGRREAWIARGWRSADAVMAQLDRVLVAFEAMVEAKRAAASGAPGVVEPQVAFERAGGLTAWFAMMEAARGLERPPGAAPQTCATVPVSY